MIDHTQRAIAEFGLTNYLDRAGYILKDGSLLDFTYGVNPRDDHRSISAVYDEFFPEATDYLLAFMKEGNIRCIPEVPGVDILVKPTERQYLTLRKYISYFLTKEGNFFIDLPNENCLQYDAPYFPVSKIIEDIKYFFNKHEN